MIISAESFQLPVPDRRRHGPAGNQHDDGIWSAGISPARFKQRKGYPVAGLKTPSSNLRNGAASCQNCKTGEYQERPAHGFKRLTAGDEQPRPFAPPVVTERKRQLRKIALRFVCTLEVGLIPIT